jgi:hypothetical protein
MADTIKTLGIIAIIYGALILLVGIGIGVASLASFTFITDQIQQYMPNLEEIAAGTLSAIVGIILFIIFANGILWFLGGLGLLYRRNWGRILIVIAAIISLFNFPIGTALGIIYLVFMFKDRIEKQLK